MVSGENWRDRRRSDRNDEPRLGTARIGAIVQRECAAVRFRDLPAQHETDSSSVGLRRVEWDEQVRAVCDAMALIDHAELECVVRALPLHPYGALRLDRRLDRIAHEVDQELLELVRIRLNAERWSLPHVDTRSLRQLGDAMHPFRHIDGGYARMWQSRESRVGGHEAAERLRARADDGEAALDVLQPIIRTRRT